MGAQSDSSSGEENGDAEWRKAVSSVAATTSSYINGAVNSAAADADAVKQRRDQKPKHYQLKMQKLLDEMLEKSLVMVNEDNDGDDTDVVDSGTVVNNGDGFRLFKNSTPGLTILDHLDEPRRPRRRPRILPREEIDEKSKKFKRRLRLVAIEGSDVISAAENAIQKSRARIEAKEAAEKIAAKAEEERVAELKRVRGERWLPSLAGGKFK